MPPSDPLSSATLTILGIKAGGLAAVAGIVVIAFPLGIALAIALAVIVLRR